MTCLPQPTSDVRLGLVIDLDTCVGCQACVTSCKEWNTGGSMAPLTDVNPYGGDVDGVRPDHLAGGGRHGLHDAAVVEDQLVPHGAGRQGVRTASTA